ncbi:MAG: Obg family GTPase CgtA, partial [Acidobacteria bacterium]|nr:Obg family GTPase CgtA [Acidobacteriota bacterium]
MRELSRRQMLRLSGSAAAGAWLSPALLRAASPPVAPVAITRCRGYGKEMAAALDDLFQKLGGLKPLVGGKTVAIKINLTGGVRPVLGGRSAGQTYHVHPDLILACCQAFARAGAKRIRLLEGWPPPVSAEKFLGECGWNLRALKAAGNVEWENTNNRGAAKQYSPLKVRHAGYIYPSFAVNHSYEDADFFVSGTSVERWAAMTDLEEEEGLEYLHRRLTASGIIRKLETLGAKEGDTVAIRALRFAFVPEALS